MHNFLFDADFEIRFKDTKNKKHITNISLERNWDGNFCASKILNNGATAVSIKEIVLFKGKMPFSPETKIYGEGYSKLSQYGGKISKPEQIGAVSDHGHYKLPVVSGLFTVYNLMGFMPDDAPDVYIAFSSCHHYSGEIRFNEDYYEMVLDFENMDIQSGQTIKLEEVMFYSGNGLLKILPQLANRLVKNHPKPTTKEVPTGWCSWYSFGPDLTRKDVINNLKAIKEKSPNLKYIQIDEGYAAHEGDWLLPGKNFPGGVKKLCHTIKEMGFEPAMWVGPFIAEADSQVLKNHPEWFVKDSDGNPAPADKYTFGGWYHGPWYMLDGTHPEAQDYLRHVFRTMNKDWGVNYFKMDGTMWGALPFGHRYDKTSTRIDAYRMGMKAIREGAGKDSFLMGCNAPMWATLGTVNAMRLSGDIGRSWRLIKNTAKENLLRSWQHPTCWIGDPDCLILQNIEKEQIGPDGKVNHYTEGGVTKDEYAFHTAAIFAINGMVMSGDDFTDITKESANIINKLVPPLNTAAVFDDDTMCIGRTSVEDKLYITVLNWEDKKQDFNINLEGHYKVFDYLNNNVVSENTNKISIKSFDAHCGKIYECTKISL